MQNTNNSNNWVQKKLSQGLSVLGTWSLTGSPMVVECMAQAGLDFIILDHEHGLVNQESTYSQILACERHNVSPVIRVSGINEHEILAAQDLGAQIVQIPNVHSLADARQVIKFALYPPQGERGFSPFTRAGGFCSQQGKQLISQSNSNLLVAIHLEGEAALAQLPAMLALEHIDIYFIGLFDLAKSMGLLGEIDHPKVLAHLEKCVTQIRQANKIAGSIVTNEIQLRRMQDLGVRYITYSTDTEILLKSYQQIRNQYGTRT